VSRTALAARPYVGTRRDLEALAKAEGVGGTSGTDVVPPYNSVRTELLRRRSRAEAEARAAVSGDVRLPKYNDVNRHT
jgi:hypothetical protein